MLRSPEGRGCSSRVRAPPPANASATSALTCQAAGAWISARFSWPAFALKAPNRSSSSMLACGLKGPLKVS